MNRNWTENQIQYNTPYDCYYYWSPNIKSRRLRWAGHVARGEEGRSSFKILTVTSTGKGPLGRPRRR